MGAVPTTRALDGYNVRFGTALGDKETRAKPVSAQVEAGNVKLVRALRSDDWLRILENFPTGKHDDETDALSSAHQFLSANSSGAFDSAAIKSMMRFRGPTRRNLNTDFGWPEPDFPDIESLKIW